MNIYIIIAIIGIISGILCALADVPLAYSGKKDKDEVVQAGKISPWWSEVPKKHFTIAFWLSCIGQPGTYVTMWMLAVLISQNNSGLGMALKINTFIGAYTGLLFHAAACIKPLIYQRIYNKMNIEDTQAAVDSINKLVLIPSLISGISLFLGTTVITATAIFSGALDVPKFLVLFNPIIAALIFLPLKKAKVRIVGPLGVGFILFSIVLLIAGVNLKQNMVGLAAYPLQTNQEMFAEVDGDANYEAAGMENPNLDSGAQEKDNLNAESKENVDFNFDETKPEKTSVGDIDGNGVEEYFLVTMIKDNEDYEGHFDFYLNDKLIYGYDDILRIFAGEAFYIDLDEDGKQEIFLTFYPMVNSMPLIEYAVLKEDAGEWKALEIPHGEDMLDNAFPIHVKYGQKACEIEISCDGYSPIITYDFTKHYESLLSNSDTDAGFDMSFQNILQGNNYKQGEAFGGVLAWGIWDVTCGTFEGENCLIAEHGLGGPDGKYDMLGTLNIYFHYTSDEKVEIVNMEFIPEESIHSL